MILALHKSPMGGGSLRYWVGFLFDTDIQSEVEEFMCSVHQNDYFLVEPSTLGKTAAGNFVCGSLCVFQTPVHVKTKGKRTFYTIKT